MISHSAPGLEREALGVPPFVLYADPEAIAERARRSWDQRTVPRLLDPQDDVAGTFRSALPVRPIALCRSCCCRPAGAGQRIRPSSRPIEQAVADVTAGHASAVSDQSDCQIRAVFGGVSRIPAIRNFWPHSPSAIGPARRLVPGHDARQRRAARRAVDRAYAACRACPRADTRAHI